MEGLLKSSRKIAEGHNSLIYFNDNGTFEKPVVLKTLKDEFSFYPHYSQILNEDEHIRNIKVPGVRSSLDLLQINNKQVLVLEYFEGNTLKEWITKGDHSIMVRIKTAIKICRALHGIHENHIIHKDLNSYNILINSLGEISIIDFGLSTSLNVKSDVKGISKYLEGTLPYISPEQTGRMNHVIDHRSDLYSFGVILFEIFTGVLPFISSDPMELVHAHLAKTPTPPCLVNQDVPGIISDIILKLLNKNVEDRYQSSFGLLNDLEKCLKQMELKVQIQDFDLAADDLNGKFLIPGKLYGRQQETDTLLNSFAKIGEGQKEIMLIEGYTGTGKTSLVKEIHKPVTLKNGYFIHGKHEQFQKDVPYYAIIQAVDVFIEYILSESKEKLAEWKKGISEAIGNEGKLLTDIIPNLELIIGPQESVEKLGINEAQNRLTYTFIQFLKAIATEKSPIVLFIDDLQWADIASLTLLKNIITELELPYLYFIGAYRYQEVDATHPTALILEEIRKQNIVINRIKVKDLTIPDLEELIKDTLKCDLEYCIDLIDIVYNKTHGNPFFVNQFLQSMHENGLIRYEVNTLGNKGKWIYDSDEIKKMNFADNVVEFMLSKIKKLGQEVQEILKLASCIGDSFDLKTIQYISNMPVRDIARNLWDALKEQYIFSDGNQHDLTRLLISDFADSPEDLDLSYTFAHDRIRQASYELIPKEEKAELHQKIGQLMLDKMDEHQGYKDHIFDVVYHLNRADSNHLIEGRRHELARLNFIAGKKAKASAAYQTALSYFEIAIWLGHDSQWDTHHDFLFDLHFNAMECAFLVGDYTQMERLKNILLDHSKNILESAKVKNIQIYALIAQNRHFELIDYGLKLLKDLDIRLPKNPKNHHIIFELVKTKWLLKNKNFQDLEHLPKMENEKVALAINIMSSISTASYHNLPKLFPLAIFKAIQLSLKYGNSTDAIAFFGGYGSLLCGVTNDFENGFKYGQLSLKLLDDFRKTKHIRPKTYVIFAAFINHWKQHLDQSMDYLRKGYMIAMESGDPQYAASALFIQSYNRFFLGENLDLLFHDIESFRVKMDQLNQVSYNLYFKIFMQAIKNLSVSSDPDNYMMGDIFDESEFSNSSLSYDKTALFHIHFHKFFLNYLLGNHQKALQISDQTQPYLEVVVSTYYVPLYYFYDSLVRAAIYRETEGDSQKKNLLKSIVSNQKKMKKWMDAAPMNFLHKYLLVEAELQAYCYKNQVLAMQYFGDSIKKAGENGYINEVALANELAGKYYGKLDLPDQEAKFIERSYESYAKCGMKVKEKQLTKKYPHVFSKSDKANVVKTQSYTTQLNTNSLLDLSSILKSSITISSEIRLEKVVQKLLSIVLENAGAQSGSFILCQNDQLELYASIDVNGRVIHHMSSILDQETTSASFSIIRFVQRTKENLILDDARSDQRFMNDPYVQSNKLASVICSPVLYHGELLGILFLENMSIKGAFNQQRLEILNMLSGQIAITVNNALLYENLENKVHERTIEINRQKEQLKRQNIELKNINDEKDDLINVVSHDLRSPLNQIKGLAELTSAISDDKEVKEYTSMITVAADRLNNMIVRILDISAIESQKIDLRYEDFEIVSTIYGFTKDYYAVARKKKIELKTDSNVQAGMVRLDKNLLIQIIENLVSNAIKFSEENKSVVIVITHDKEELQIEVRDQGPGISEEDKKRLFHKFQKLSAQPTAGEKSIGLGLSIVKKYVETMGGKIWCESEPGKGCSFFINFPIGTPKNELKSDLV